MNVNEIFTSLSGECDGFGNQGGLATFVRLQGCNLKCRWCDTKDARNFENWEEMSVEEVAKRCTTRYIIITGGEPLLQQEEVAELIGLLCPYGRKDHLITIETNGSILPSIYTHHTRYETLRLVVDYKLDSSGESESMVPEFFRGLYELDVIKFVIADLQDYRQAKDILLKNPDWSAKKVFSPVPKGNWPYGLAKAMISDKLEGIKFSLQWHKVLDIK